MIVSIIEDGQVIWMRDTKTLEGLACTNYVKDGIQQRVIAALVDALEQANGQLQLANNVN